VRCFRGGCGGGGGGGGGSCCRGSYGGVGGEVGEDVVGHGVDGVKVGGAGTGS